MDYLEGNTALAMDVLMMIDLVKLKLKSILKIDMITLDNTKCHNDDVDEIDDSLAVALLHALTEEEYCEIWSKLIDVNNNSIPSHYAMIKARPAMVTLQYGKIETDTTTTTASDLLLRLDSVIDNVWHQDKKQLKVASKDMDVNVLAKNY